MNGTSRRVVLLASDQIERTIARLAHQIVEPDDVRNGLVLLGVRRGGEALATRLAAAVTQIAGRTPVLGFVNIDRYRDDHVTHDNAESQIPVDVTDRIVVVVDDVLYTGRTVRSALDAVTDLGRPAAVRLCVLIDRGLRELPIQADYVGRSIPTGKREHIAVRLATVPSPEDEVAILADSP